MFENFSARRWFSAAPSPASPRRACVLAVLDIYERDGVYVGGWLERSEIVSEWSRSGFRNDDLGPALDDAVRWGLLEIVEQGDAPQIRLLSTVLPALDEGDWTRRMRDELLDRSLQVQRARRASNRPWSGVDRRRTAHTA